MVMKDSKVALVTASSAGLGAAVAKALAPTHRVVINYFSRPEKANEVLKECESVPAQYEYSGPRFHAIQCDMGKRSDIERLVKDTITVMGRLDVVISNQGWTKMTNFFDINENVDEEIWDKCFNYNVKSHLFLFHAIKPHLDGNEDGGNFVTIASLAGVRPSGSSMAYSVTKAAEIHLTKALAIISGPKIRCNCFSPGLMMTEWGEKLPDALVKATMAKAVLKTAVSLDDAADQIKSLATTKSMTGQNVVVDGGVAI